MKEAGITHEDIEYIVFYDKPLLKVERLLKPYLVRKDAKDYFFPSDGHFTIAGNKKLADFLLID